MGEGCLRIACRSACAVLKRGQRERGRGAGKGGVL